MVNLSGKRVLVFGGSGLIGKPACARLRALGAEVGVFSRRAAPEGAGIQAFRGDIANRDNVRRAFAEFGPDSVLQLAACLQGDVEKDPESGVATNLTGATNILAAAANSTVTRFVFGSSIAAYGERCDLMREDDTPSASISLYGMQKRLGEALGQRFSEIADFEFMALRYSGIFGPGEVTGAGMSLARHLLFKTADGRAVTLDFASGEETAHLTYLEDAVEATVRALSIVRPSYRIYNVGGPSSNHVSLRRFHEMIRELAPSAGDATFLGRSRSAGPVDTTRMVRDLGYEPRYEVKEALGIMIGHAPS